MAVAFEDETYSCQHCSGPVGDTGEVAGWKCQSCGSYLLIQAEYPRGTRRVLERVDVSDIQVSDRIVLSGTGLDQAYEVLAIGNQNGVYRVALMGYGLLKRVKPYKRFNRVTGAW